MPVRDRRLKKAFGGVISNASVAREEWKKKQTGKAEAVTATKKARMALQEAEKKFGNDLPDDEDVQATRRSAASNVAEQVTQEVQHYVSEYERHGTDVEKQQVPLAELKKALGDGKTLVALLAANEKSAENRLGVRYRRGKIYFKRIADYKKALQVAAELTETDSCKEKLREMEGKDRRADVSVCLEMILVSPLVELLQRICSSSHPCFISRSTPNTGCSPASTSGDLQRGAGGRNDVQDRPLEAGR